MVLNPKIWYLSEIKIKCEFIGRIDELIRDEFKSNEDMIIDVLLNSLERYISLDPIKYTNVIDKLWTLIRKYVLKNISYKVIKIIIILALLCSPTDTDRLPCQGCLSI